MFTKLQTKMLNRRLKKHRVPASVVKLVHEMRYIHENHQRYQYGGQHAVSIDKISAKHPMDCSSSVSLALYRAGLFHSNPGYAPVSGWFESWGEPGHGKYFTIMCNAEHIWIKLNIPGFKWWRFDTSSWGCGDPSGARLRKCERSTYGFIQRHVKGL